MNCEEYLQYDGLGLSELLFAGEVTPAELMECAISLAQRRGGRLNAICHPQYEAARELAAAHVLQGPFGGLPLLLKDSGLASTRLPSSLGSRLFRDMRFSQNATLVDRFERAGFLPFARTTVPELCMAPTTEAAVYGGPTLNPWDDSRSSGGSSGGAAAAVAAGVVPIAHGSDGGGSIRIPAAACGVYGLKPSRGLVPMGPTRGEGWGGLACDGVLTRSVRDTAAVLDEIAGMETGAPYAAPPKPDSYLQATFESTARPLKIAFWIQAWNQIEISADAKAAVFQAAELCESLGHTVVETTPPDIDYEGFIDALIRVMAANIKVAVDTRLATTGQTLQDDDLEPAMRDGYALGARVSAAEYVMAIQRFHHIGRVFAAALTDVDLVLTPALTRTAVELGTISMRQPSFTEFRQEAARYTTFLALINAAGLPAASVPINHGRDGLPVACQIVAGFGREDLILQLSAQLERAHPWSHRRPAFADERAGARFPGQAHGQTGGE